MALAGCSLDVHSRPELRFIGEVAPAPNQPACQKTTGILLLRENEVTFAPDEGTWILNGSASPDGALEAENSREGSDKTTYDTRLIARWTADAVTGTYTTPRCAYRVNLRRQ